MSDVTRWTATQGALALRDLAVKHSLGPLQTVRLDPGVAAQAGSAATQILSVPRPGDLLAPLSPGVWLPGLLDLAGRLLWTRQHPATRVVLGVVREIGELLDTGERLTGTLVGAVPPWRELCAGYLALTDLTELGIGQPTTAESNLSQVTNDLLTAADHYLAHDDVRRAALVASAGLWVLFHQELHDARPTSPLVSNPDEWLLPLTGSRVGRLLTGRPGEGPGAAMPGPPPAGPCPGSGSR